MPLGERITSVDKLRAWTDQIPMRYVYTAGVAGEKFLRGLQDGKIVAARCRKCGKRYLPPKMYCTDCFVEIGDYRAVGPSGTVAAVAESHVDFDGARLASPRTFVFVTFGGVEGGLVQRASGRGLKIGDRVEPRFKAPKKREGSMADFQFARISR